MLGLQSSPKDDSGLSPAEAIYGSTLSLPGEFLKHSEFPPESFLRNVEKAVLGFSGPPQHHVLPQPLPRALLNADFVFVHDDASKPPLSPLYRGPYRVLHCSEKFFVLQIGDKSDSVSVDRLKPVFSSVPVVPAEPPLRGRPCLVPASVPKPTVPRHPLVKKVTFSPVKKVSFSPVPATQLHQNPHLLGGVTVATRNLTITFGTVCSMSPSLKHALRSPRHYAGL